MRGAKSATWVAGAIAVALTATACGGGGNDSDDNAAVNPDGTYTYYNVEPQNPIIPSNTNEVGGGYIVKNLFRGLVDFDEKSKLRLVAAESIDTADNQTFKVKLKPGWKFHNGEDQTAASFVDAWNWAANAKNKQLNASWFEPIKGYDEVHPAEGDPKAEKMEGLKVTSDLEFTIELKKPVSTFKEQLFYDVFSPLPKAFYKDTKAFGEHPIGNGPYQQDGDWQHKVEFKTKKFADYKGDDKPKNGGVVFKFYNKDDAAYNDLVSDKLDIMYQVPNSMAGQYQNDLGKRAISQMFGGNTNISFPLYEAEWNKPEKVKVRQGLSMAIDRETIAKTALKGSKDAADGYTPKVVEGYQAGSCGEFCKFDPAKAKELIKAGGGVPGNKITLTYNADGANKEWADAVCNDIRQNGGVECVTDPKPTFQQARADITERRMKSAFRMAWVQDFPNIQNFISAQYRTKAGANDMEFSDKAIDELMDKADASKTIEESNKLYAEAEKKIIQEHMPSIPLFFDHTLAGYSKKVQNVKFDSFRQAIWTDVEVKK
ncbi:ABC transporter substrate-binding protein [Streptomyces albireticuli]|uniref:Peptide ABC transporter substrate-binding protein n=1 Tax=Streptomyces albireticuli TaxID=1940 RepID=A0A2A2DEC2_9ACTN|nr:ABC transporter substrate-binding protein [Streptomyces albireticuli]MCD9142612.1 ABC transporter substrate-binding protein [Streptomyces albireticuli]MCD9164011.1 ABC transporter substrate-binding protein [Streptomyces albireticuli]MCD9192740.1 ABC transporter substrate-binding protein [Streptomyces albireticuli]PAU49796.1 peptide ABC transporter substrate-binding protein [Streptomyces albireticuli]